jgi:hypothetical protein
VDFELKSLFKWAWTFKQMADEQPHLNTIIAQDGTLNLAQLAPALRGTDGGKGQVTAKA